MSKSFFYAETDKGKQRDSNQDRVIAQPLWDDNTALLAAIDGVGGYDGGEVAADVASECIVTYLSSYQNGERPQLLKEAIAKANNEIYAQAQTDLKLARMSCVLSVAIADRAKQLVYFGHVGDTRIYRFRAGKIEKLTKDHSLVGFREEAGELSETEAMNHPQRNEILRSLGNAPRSNRDDDYIDIGVGQFLPNDILLLCSDGLSDMLTAQQIISVLNENEPLETKAKALINAANEAGGKDNISVVLATYTQEVKIEKAQNKAIKPIEIAEPANDISTETTEKKTTAMTPTEPPSKTHSWLNLLIGLLLGSLIAGLASWAWFTQSPTSQKEKQLMRDSIAIYRDSTQILKDSLKVLKPDSTKVVKTDTTKTKRPQ